VRTVSRYLLAEFARASTVVFLGLAVTWLAADALLHVADLTREGSGEARAMWLRLLAVVPLGVPMACLVGVVLSVCGAVRHREITAIRCGGIPLRRALTPILLASALLVGGLMLFEDRVLVPAQRRAERADDGEPRLTRSNGHWWYASGRSVFSAERLEPESRTLGGVTLFELDGEGRLLRRIDAAAAVHVAGETWEFRGVRVRELPRAARLEQHDATVLRASLSLQPEELRRALPEPRLLTLHKLARALREFEGNAAERAPLLATFHDRLARPLAALVLVLLAIPLALGDTERGDSLPRALLQATVAAALFWAAWTGALLASQGGLVAAPLALWGTVALFLSFGFWRFSAIRE
jgi:lipopolysaccharide export system permease protein